MSKTLATAIHMTDDSGVVHSFLPGSTPPKWARSIIDNPKVWGDDAPDDAEAVDEPQPAAEDEAEQTGATTPPRKNGSTPAWRAYADAMGFEVDDDVSRNDIIAALKANGIPTD